MHYLDTINSSTDIKKLPESALPILATEVRTAILNRVSQTGGHVGPNLGIVEATIALHYVFDTPVDRLVFDVSHQCYPHKILTGRKDYFLDPDKMNDMSGYTTPRESDSDSFIVGHTSTSVSLACGLAVARDRLSQSHRVIAVIGDGSLSGGEALEGLDFAGSLNTNLIIVVNDNEMSIAENHGGLYQNLRELRETKGQAECNLFKSFGLDYKYVENGNNISDLITAFTQVRDCQRPTVVHIHTQKGKGYAPAEEKKEFFHHTGPFDLATGKPTTSSSSENYLTISSDFLITKAQNDPKVVILNAGTPSAVGFTPQKRQQLGSQFIDVGIAEEHACAMASALAAGGCKSVWCVLSSFVQRTYDQLSHDLALNNNPAVVLVFWTGITAADATHQSTFDIPMISNIPNLVCLAPTTKEEYLSMLNWAIDQTEHPVVIRVPSVVSYGAPAHTDYANINTSVVTRAGSDVAILALGSFYTLGEQIADKLALSNIHATLINPRYIGAPDKELLNNLRAKHRLVVTLEDGEVAGGFGQKVASFYGPTDMKVMVYGARKEFTDRISKSELFDRYHLTPDHIVNDIFEVLK